MTPSDKKVILAGRTLIREFERAYGKEVADKIWLELIEVMPNGQELAKEILLDTLRNSSYINDTFERVDEEVKAVIDELRYRKISFRLDEEDTF